MSERRLGYYVYCVLRAGERPSLDGVAGVDASYGIELLTHGDLTAAISLVGLDEFGSEALTRNLEDLAWLKRTVLAHNAVLAQARGSDALVPFSACTIFEDQARVRQMLERQQDYFRDTLQRLRGRDEWSVKMLADRQRLEATAREHHQAPVAAGGGRSQTPGHAFFARKKVDDIISAQAATVAETAARRAHVQLRQHAAEARLLRPQDPRLSGRRGEMVLNGAYLVDRVALPEFATTVDQLRQDGCPDGVELALSGPFAPYNFVGTPEAP